MKFNIKKYKLNRLKKHFKKNFFLIYFGSDEHSINEQTLQQNLKKLYLKYYHVNNSLIKKILSFSIFKNYKIIAQGKTLFIYFKNFDTSSNLKIKNLTKLSSNIYLLGIKLNNKIYKIAQIKKISAFSYHSNIQFLNLLLKSNIKKLNIKL